MIEHKEEYKEEHKAATAATSNGHLEREKVLAELDAILRYHGMESQPNSILANDNRDDREMMVYYQFKKSSLYVVNLLREKEHPWQIGQRKVIERLLEQDLRVDRVMVLHLYIIEEIPSLSSYPAADLDKRIIDVYWQYDCREKRLLIPDGQPNSFLNLEGDFRKLCHSDFQRELDLKEKVLAKKGGLPWVSAGLIALMAVISLIMTLLPQALEENAMFSLGLNSILLLNGEWYRLLTAVFLHVGFSHLLMNCAGIMIFGMRLEERLSGWNVLFVFLFGALMGNVASVSYHLLRQNYSVFSFGSSGGVYALMGGLLALTYANKKGIRGLDSYAVFLYFMIGSIASVLNVQVDMMAHLGGFFTGVVVTAFMIRRKWKQSMKGRL